MKSRSVHRCSDCGADYPRWQGRCDVCGGWNTLVEELLPAKSSARKTKGARQSVAQEAGSVVSLRNVESTRTARRTSGLRELDFVLGGGVVPGSMILVGGEPGIGKSTLLLQVAGALTDASSPVLYVSGEESALQIKMRGERLQVGDDVQLLCETSLEIILATAAHVKPSLMVIDSIQTVATEELEGAPGNVGQVRECAARLMRFAKSTGAAVVVVGHVTKGGGIAGPKTLEHIVDTVLYFEGEGSADHRVLRATKNRFGSVDEIGVFRMSANGLIGVDNPSALFLGDREARASGSVTAALIEGTRPLLVEVQALAAKAGFGTPQRVATGFDGRRLALLLAVLDKRTGLSFASLDVFLNVVGGISLHEPAGDLAVAAALASSVYDRPLGSGVVCIGEVGLGGEIRPVSQLERRVGEAGQLGFDTAYVSSRGTLPAFAGSLRVVPVDSLRALFDRLFN